MDPSSPETPQPNPAESTKTATVEHEGGFFSKAKNALAALTHLGRHPTSVETTGTSFGSVNSESPQADDSPMIPDRLAAASNPESADVVAAASVNTGSIDTSNTSGVDNGVPTEINTAPPIDGTVGAPTPMVLRPDTADTSPAAEATQPPVAPTAETPAA